MSDQGLHCLLTECSIKIGKQKKISPNTPKIGNRLILPIRVGKSIWGLKWVNGDQNQHKIQSVRLSVFPSVMFLVIVSSPKHRGLTQSQCGVIFYESCQ